MIRTIHQVFCDTPLCYEVSAVFDGALSNPQEVRRELHRDKGWSRRYSPARDVCPNCTKKAAAAKRTKRPAGSLPLFEGLPE